MQFSDPAWYQALTLSERAAAVHGATGGFDASEAQRRLQEWRLQPPFERRDLFASRLEQAGLCEPELLRLLGEPPQALAARHAETPPWMADMLAALADPALWEPIPWSEAAAAISNLGFLGAATPLVNQARQRLRAGVAALRAQSNSLPFEPETVEAWLLPDLARRLIPIVSRTLVLELNVARLQGLLSGETGPDRFASFVQRLQQPEVALALWQEYPVLARQVVVAAGQWAGASLEFLQHLCADWDAIRAAFFANGEPGLVAGVEAGAGDHHGDGRSVIIVNFSRGGRLVYKPRSLAADRAFQALLSQLNAWGAQPAFWILRLLERDRHGWVEYVQAAPCATLAAVNRFYERLGGYQALLYALEASDFHHENLIAAGEHPALIDLEALFQPNLDEIRGEDPAAALLRESVMRTGLLPARDWGARNGQGLDISGLGGAPGQVTPFDVGQWEASGSDAMRLVRRPVSLTAKQNQPTLEGRAVNPARHADALAAGFIHVYRLLMRHRDDLLAPSGPLTAFVRAEVRVVLRETLQYDLLLDESFHPDLAREALNRGRLFDKLWLASVDAPWLQRALPAEQAALLRGDIPRFVTRPTSRDLWADNGLCLPDFLAETGMARVCRRLANLTEADLQQQLGFVRAALMTLAEEAEHGEPARPPVPAAQYPATRDELRAMACHLGDQLAAQVVLQGDEAGWLGLSQGTGGRLVLAPLGLDLSDGLPGVALFLGYLGHLTGDEDYGALARAALRTVQRRLVDAPDQVTGIGAFDGGSGLVYAFTHLGSLWHEPALLSQAQALAASLASRIVGDLTFDVVGGAAGCLGALLALYQATGDAAALALAIRCGDHLRQHAQPQAVGLAWPTPAAAKAPLTGFAHGAAGIAWACAQLAAATGEARFMETAQAALAYERGLFDAEAGNWPDLRPQAQARFMVAWCHGAAGIGLSRLSQPGPAARAEVETAVLTTLAGGLGGSHCLCHGNLGNLDFLQAAAVFLPDRALSVQVARLAGGLLADIERGGTRCGLPRQVETPGLLTGLAGIGYGLLRLAEPEEVPCLLLLAPPNPQL